jgi:hypothetical protein
VRPLRQLKKSQRHPHAIALAPASLDKEAGYLAVVMKGSSGCTVEKGFRKVIKIHVGGGAGKLHHDMSRPVAPPGAHWKMKPEEFFQQRLIVLSLRRQSLNVYLKIAVRL